jgi:hypothetical protein
MTRKLCRWEKVRFQVSLSLGSPTVKPPPWMVRRVGSLGEVVAVVVVVVRL